MSRTSRTNTRDRKRRRKVPGVEAGAKVEVAREVGAGVVARTGRRETKVETRRRRKTRSAAGARTGRRRTRGSGRRER